MRVYRWNPLERTFLPSPMKQDMASGEGVLLESVQMGKGQHFRGESTTNERIICLLRGSWRLKVADGGCASADCACANCACANCACADCACAQLIVRRNEAVIIPSGLDHWAEAIEDSFALQMIPQ